MPSYVMLFNIVDLTLTQARFSLTKPSNFKTFREVESWGACMCLCIHVSSHFQFLVSDNYDAVYFTGYESLTEAAYSNGE